ncbi:hypothetical protein HQ45_06585 [Porphyromonas crevioricanis]|uniref:Ribosomal RNA small subunit methyltransferase F n=1 Tax=Porphyromonas crevioricanis TaxID=393921 RepID=A0A0A2FMX7_9PORP|nr:NOL1/NOP2/sun family protein [Porphyromonas crevioricanis]KGN89659.1 hypothetical protein HQ45_06585 [Porphyromonas crevioricanis]GAD08056.1 NOL1/NOP2/sun family protein [Porphyromonas crevioricanis JCM 13913]SQH72410.1 Ribosomal RNA small subunit methyltransferase F [Porphyromonas crevioricanis]
MIHLPPLPKGFAADMQELLGEEESQQLLHAIEQPPTIAIRMHPYKATTGLIQCALPFSEVYNSPYKRIPWYSPWGVYLPERPSFTADPLFHGAAYYVQEPSSMALSLIRPLLGTAPITALDLCAAPGGKATLLADILPTGSTLVANEVVWSRAGILAENMRKWGYSHTICSAAEPSVLSRSGVSFDLILVDAPCSGEGMFRKDPDSRLEWSRERVAQSAKRAREILDEAWKMLKPGGLLVYSTCTYNRQENEENVAYLLNELGAKPVELDTSHIAEMEAARRGISGYSSATTTFRFMPHRTEGEGIFMALVRKEDQDVSMAHRKSKRNDKQHKGLEDIPLHIRQWLTHHEDFVFRNMADGFIHAIPKPIIPVLEQLESANIRLIMAGIDFAELKGRNYAPAPALAFSIDLDFEAFDRVDLCREEAQHYLQRQAISLHPEANKGYLLITYAGLPLGFVKNVGNRANNLYPHEWRIRMDLSNASD